MSDMDSSVSVSNSDDTYFSDDNSECFSSDSLGCFVRKSFSNYPNNFNVCHINAQSLPSHYTDFLETFCNTNAHAILISETWLKPNLLSTSYPLPGFLLIRNDRIGNRGGGVAIYLRSHIAFKIISTSPSCYAASAEYIFLEVDVNSAKVVLGVVYCPPVTDYFTDLEHAFDAVASDYTHHIIMGDFNTDLNHTLCRRSQKLIFILQAINFNNLPLNPTHHNKNSKDTWLDLIIVSAPHLVSSHGQCYAPGFSHHDLIFLSYIIKVPKPPPKVLHLRSFAHLDVQKLREDAFTIEWANLIAEEAVDTKVRMFNDTVLKLYDKHAPIRSIKIKRPPAQWITEGVRMAMRRRNKAFRLYRRFRSEENWSLYKAARNRCNQMIRNAKRRHILDNISNSAPANIWKFLGSLGISRSRNSICTPSIDLDLLNQNFCFSSSLDPLIKSQTTAKLASLPFGNFDQFVLSPVSQNVVKKKILAIKSNAVGCDDISRRMIVLILDCILPVITHLINFSLNSKQFPSQWRRAYVKPLPKITNPTLPAHYRPISILPFLSKVLESCVFEQLSSYFYNNNLLSCYQSGFRPGHSTTTALLKVTDDIRAGMEDTKVTILTLIDFSNAFNAVDHDVLLSILACCNFSPSALEWFSNYLRGRQQSVRVDDHLSDWCDLTAGVPQGGILSPLLFSAFINRITRDLSCAFHLYADDLQLYTQVEVENLPLAISKINLDLEYINKWCQSYGLTVNPTKCQAIIVGSPRQIQKIKFTNLPSVMYNGSAILFTNSVKNLGLHIDHTLSWNVHITEVNRKVTGILRALYRFKNFLPSKTKTMLVQTLIFPIIDYADVCYLDLNSNLLNKLDRLLNNCIRFIFSLRKYDHVSAYRSQLNWLPIRQRRNLRVLSTVYSVLNEPSSPSYLKCGFQFLSSAHDRHLRSKNKHQLVLPQHFTGFYNHSFVVQAALLWNALPEKIRSAPSRYCFKNKVRHFYLDSLAMST